MMNKVLINGRVFCLLMLTLTLSLYGAWMVNVQLGYGYSWLYEFYETEQHISRYAPQNKYRSGFETLSVAEHKEIFQQIVDSVHNDGMGLEDIRYQYEGRSIPLLHEAERLHLIDVANLINNFHSIAWLCLVLVVLGLLAENRHRRLHTSRASFLGIMCVCMFLLVLITSSFLIWGAKAIFYQLHVLIFPADHQWFFYYQDSLMSTLMKAPDLFAGIAVQIVFLGLIFYALLLTGIQQLLKRRQAAEG